MRRLGYLKSGSVERAKSVQYLYLVVGTLRFWDFVNTEVLAAMEADCAHHSKSFDSACT